MHGKTTLTLKLSNTVGLLSKIRHFVPFHTCSLFTIRLNCLGTSWQNSIKLLILQKRALCFMCFADRHDHAIPLFLRAQTLPIHFFVLKIAS